MSINLNKTRKKNFFKGWELSQKPCLVLQAAGICLVGALPVPGLTQLKGLGQKIPERAYRSSLKPSKPRWAESLLREAMGEKWVFNLKRNILKLYYFCQNDINYDNNMMVLLISKQTNKDSYREQCAYLHCDLSQPEYFSAKWGQYCSFCKVALRIRNNICSWQDTIPDKY